MRASEGLRAAAFTNERAVDITMPALYCTDSFSCSACFAAGIGRLSSTPQLQKGARDFDVRPEHFQPCVASRYQLANREENVGPLGNVSSGLKHTDASWIGTATGIVTLHAAVDRPTTQLR